MAEESCSSVYRLSDGSELEISYVELTDEDVEYRHSEREHINALYYYLLAAKAAKTICK